VTAILVVERDPGVCNFLIDALEYEFAAFVKCVSTAPLGAKAIDTGCFDLAIIDVGLSQMSGYELAKRAANRNIPSLLCSGHPQALAKLRQYDLPHLAKPFNTVELTFAAAQVIVYNQENIRRIKDSFARLQITTDGLRADLAESRRLMKQSEALLIDRGLQPS
jgi:DNA-binding response OmpR family regulator